MESQSGPVPMITESQADLFIRENQVALVYYSLPDCSVCHAVQPRLLVLAERLGLPVLMISIPQQLSYSAQHLVFAAPTILIYHEGREIERQSRFIDFRQLNKTLSALLEKPEEEMP